MKHNFLKEVNLLIPIAHKNQTKDQGVETKYLLLTNLGNINQRHHFTVWVILTIKKAKAEEIIEVRWWFNHRGLRLLPKGKSKSEMVLMQTVKEVLFKIQSKPLKMIRQMKHL